MKNTLFYYYQINPEKIIKKNNYYYFELNNCAFYLYLLDKPIEYIKELLMLNDIIINSNFFTIIFNNNGEAVSLIDNHYYILLKGTIGINANVNDLYHPYHYSGVNNLKFLNHSNWGELWSIKVDYFEYQKEYIKVKYKLLYQTLDYFIGLSENAISYFYAVNNYLTKEIGDDLVICRRRINLEGISFYNPLNIVIDNKARDSAEYLKYLFIKDAYTYEFIDEFLINLNYSNYQYGLLMARLLFPTNYFDLYENIINGFSRENEIIFILTKSKEYEKFLKYIYRFINKKKSILQIDWLDN